MLTTHAVGIDLGTTYSCIAYLNEHGAPVTLANQEGELSTPSVVMFDGDEVIIGTEALRNAVSHPENVVQNSKRKMGDSGHFWAIDGRKYSPIDIATCILKKMLSGAQEQIGQIDEAVITVPAQFSDFQR
ncbi:MAG: Hsp70 family protein, partial [Planctomycetota bacterium]|nr:Hsp70 family protein [Planctomycetota bacterium]